MNLPIGSQSWPPTSPRKTRIWMGLAFGSRRWITAANIQIPCHKPSSSSMPKAAPASTRQSRRMGRSSTAKGTCSISRTNDRQSLNAFLMSAQISRSRKTLNRRHTDGCNDSIAGRARIAIINAQLETGVCALMERQQQRLAAPSNTVVATRSISAFFLACSYA
jgi:hypothetical protein